MSKSKEKGLTCTALALVKIEGANLHEAYQSVIITIEDGKVVATEASEPNMRNIAMETLKVDFVKTFMYRKD